MTDSYATMTPEQLVVAYEEQKAYIFQLSWEDDFYFNHGGMQAEDNVLCAIADAYFQKTGQPIKEIQCN